MAEIVCAGRPVDDRLQPTGERCGRSLRGRVAEVDQVAIAAGWALAPDGAAMCPSCRRPPPEVTALVRQVSG